MSSRSRGIVKRSGIRNSGTIWRTAVIEGETVVVFLPGDWRVMSIRKEYSTFGEACRYNQAARRISDLDY